MALQHRGVGIFEIVPGIFLLGLQEDVAIGHLVGAVAAVEVEVVDVVDALHIHRQPLQPVGQFAGHRLAGEARDLLEIGELRHLHAVAPAFPAEPPGAERRALPVVLDEAHVVERHVEADRGERLEVEVLEVRRRRLDDHLELVIVLQPVGVLAVAPVVRPPRRLDIGRLPRPRPERPQASSPGGRSPPPSRNRRAGGWRSHSPPSSAAAPGSAPGTNGPGACGSAGCRTWVENGPARSAGKRRGKL